MADSPDVEPLLPKVSLRWLIGLVTICSLSMAVIQQAVVNRQTWSILLSLALASIVLPAVLYVATFSLASLFAAFGSAATIDRWASASPLHERQHVPTAEMPAVEMPSESPPAESTPEASAQATDHGTQR